MLLLYISTIVHYHYTIALYITTIHYHYTLLQYTTTVHDDAHLFCSEYICLLWPLFKRNVSFHGRGILCSVLISTHICFVILLFFEVPTNTAWFFVPHSSFIFSLKFSLVRTLILWTCNSSANQDRDSENPRNKIEFTITILSGTLLKLRLDCAKLFLISLLQSFTTIIRPLSFSLTNQQFDSSREMFRLGDVYH